MGGVLAASARGGARFVVGVRRRDDGVLITQLGRGSMTSLACVRPDSSGGNARASVELLALKAPGVKDWRRSRDLLLDPFQLQ